MKTKPKIGYAGGTFDLFHAGHVNFLRQCSRNCDLLVVGVNTDEFCERYKRRPVMNLHERIRVVEACRYVDGTLVNWSCEDSKPTIKKSHASVIFHGDDWPIPGLMKQMDLTNEWLEAHKIKLEHVHYTHGISTGEIIGRINAE